MSKREYPNLADCLDGDLEAFIQWAEDRNCGPADRDMFEAVVKDTITAPQPEGQTSRSPAHGSKRGK
jgi:hypothetical protein